MPASIRVLAVGNAYPPHHLGGYEIAWQGVMARLRAHGHRPRVLTTDLRRAGVPPHAREDPDVHRELDWYWRDHRWRSLGLRARLQLERHNAAVLERHLAEFRPDVVTWWPVGGLSLGLIERARRRGLPAVLFVHDYWPRYAPEHDLWVRMWRGRPRLRTLAERVTGLPASVDYASVGRWSFNSRIVREDAVAAGLPVADAPILSPGVAESYLRSARAGEAAAWRWRLLYVGRVVEPKGVHTAIAALPLLPQEATLTIVGEGDATYRSSLRELASGLGVAERVRLEPGRDHGELIDVYGEADAVVFPVQWDEPWGLVPLEAMALGRPVLATGRGGSGEYLVDGENSLLFEPGDADALAAALHSLADDPALRARLREAGYETAARHSEDRFNREAVAEILAAAT